MMLDSTLTFEPKGTSLATVSAAGTSTNAIDLGVTNGIGGSNGRDIGLGTDSHGIRTFVALSGTISTSATNTTLQFKLQGAPDNGSGAPGTFVDFGVSPAYTVTELQAKYGEAFFFAGTVPPRPPGVAPPRFLQLAYVPANGSITAGTITAGLSIGNDESTAYPANFTVPPTSGAGS